MVGAPDSPGLMFLTINDLFTKIENFKYAKDFVVKVSYLEIYNENIKDLLTVEDKNLELREDPLRGVVITGITEVMTSTVSEIITIIKIGNRNRSMEPTAANEVSSRSHAILQVNFFFRSFITGQNHIHRKSYEEIRKKYCLFHYLKLISRAFLTLKYLLFILTNSEP
jgi:kinesin family protein 18/19